MHVGSFVGDQVQFVSEIAFLARVARVRPVFHRVFAAVYRRRRSGRGVRGRRAHGGVVRWRLSATTPVEMT